MHLQHLTPKWSVRSKLSVRLLLASGGHTVQGDKGVSIPPVSAPWQNDTPKWSRQAQTLCQSAPWQKDTPKWSRRAQTICQSAPWQKGTPKWTRRVHTLYQSAPWQKNTPKWSRRAQTICWSAPPTEVVTTFATLPSFVYDVTNTDCCRDAKLQHSRSCFSRLPNVDF